MLLELFESVIYQDFSQQEDLLFLKFLSDSYLVYLNLL